VRFFEVLDDGDRLRDPNRAIDENGHVRLRIKLLVLGAIVIAVLPAQCDGHVLERYTLEVQGDAHAEGGGARMKIVKGEHADSLHPSTPRPIGEKSI
jgi:hypothetical protein